MDNMCTYAAECMDLSGYIKASGGIFILDALSAGNEALEILSRLELDMSTWEGQKAKELLDEWN
jgi:hypothetical protein